MTAGEATEGAAGGAAGGTLAGAVAVLAAANVLNNRIAPRLAPLTSAAATGALVALARGSGLSWSEMGFRDGSRGLRIGGSLAAVVAAAYTAGIAIPATRRFFRDERALSLSRARVLEEALLQVPFGTVLLEEVGFRGVLQGLLARSHGTPVATAVSSALFGLWHVLPAIDMAAANPALSALAAEAGPADGSTDGPADASADGSVEASPPDVPRVVAGSVVSTGLAGVLFCELRRRGGLAAPAILHLATNSLGYLFARLAPRDGDAGGKTPERTP
ncbi:abortive infection protein [Planobispora rosea]|uniref:Abortive infection protein n=1 Tax=Planobispora rosea TaxID=35762 RepID=A0A8J3WDN5_PLARO|nr:CPBP family intramembrane glutamic endopeptidase [Planobispora rosea]GGS81670.1 abortive infection protein [Planobispora rosea]GIH86119.1 abortive infection protein [Planobispora rosea]